MTDRAKAAPALAREASSAYWGGALCVLITTRLWSTGGVFLRLQENASSRAVSDIFGR